MTRVRVGRGAKTWRLVPWRPGERRWERALGFGGSGPRALVGLRGGGTARAAGRPTAKRAQATGPRALGQGRGAAWAGEARGWAGQGKRRGMKAFSFLYFPYFFCYCVFRFWFINFEIQMNFENFE
jgi:hypothetical protein